MVRRLRQRTPDPVALRNYEGSLCGIHVELDDGRIGQLFSSNGKEFKLLINNKFEFVTITEKYKDWIVLP
jgi:hypothetical protein